MRYGAGILRKALVCTKLKWVEVVMLSGSQESPTVVGEKA